MEPSTKSRILFCDKEEICWKEKEKTLVDDKLAISTLKERNTITVNLTTDEMAYLIRRNRTVYNIKNIIVLQQESNFLKRKKEIIIRSHIGNRYLKKRDIIIVNLTTKMK